jgi:uncharacterized protein
VSARSRGAPGSGKTARAPAKECPICGKQRSEEFRPFCSKHCADVDLGRWLGGRYVVPGAPVASNATEEDDEV